MTAWGTFLPALLGAFALFTSAGLMTKRGRLRRRLDKDVTIAEKLPSGTVRDHLQAVNTRTAAELIYHEHGRGNAFITRTITAAGVVTLILAAIQLGLAWVPSDPDPDMPNAALIGVLSAVLLVMNIARQLIYRTEVRDYVNRVAEPIPPGLADGGSPLTIDTKQAHPSGGPLMQKLVRTLTREVHMLRLRGDK